MSVSPSLPSNRSTLSGGYIYSSDQWMFDDNVKCVASYLSRWCVTVAEAICFVAPSGGQFLIKKRQQDILLHCSCCCVGQSIYIQRYIKYRGISESWLQKEDMSLFQHRPSIEDHGRTLRCQALNPAMPLQSIQDTLVLDIYCEYSTDMMMINLSWEAQGWL